MELSIASTRSTFGHEWQAGERAPIFAATTYGGGSCACWKKAQEVMHEKVFVIRSNVEWAMVPITRSGELLDVSIALAWHHQPNPRVRALG